MIAPTGIDADHLVMVDGLYNSKEAWRAPQISAVVSELKEIPGVRSASAAFGLPMVPSALLNMTLVSPSGIKEVVDGYIGESLVKTLGLKIVEGRDFLPDEYSEWGVGGGHISKRSVTPIIITKSLEDRFFGGRSALGRILTLSSDGGPSSYVVVGVVSHLQRNEIGLAHDGLSDNTILLANKIGDTRLLNFAIRSISAPERSILLKKIQGVIASKLFLSTGIGGGMRVIPYSERRDATFASSRAALSLLISVMIGVMAVTLIGIGGMSGFWVQVRRKSFAIRRALGARRVDILRGVVIENLVIVGSAAAVGMFLAAAANQFLMRHYELPRLPLRYLPFGAVVAVLVGQAAAIGPALGAIRIAPFLASRSQ